jgi:hypothetical protein
MLDSMDTQREQPLTFFPAMLIAAIGSFPSAMKGPAAGRHLPPNASPHDRNARPLPAAGYLVPPAAARMEACPGLASAPAWQWAELDPAPAPSLALLDEVERGLALSGAAAPLRRCYPFFLEIAD